MADKETTLQNIASLKRNIDDLEASSEPQTLPGCKGDHNEQSMPNKKPRKEADVNPEATLGCNEAEVGANLSVQSHSRSQMSSPGATTNDAVIPLAKNLMDDGPASSSATSEKNGEGNENGADAPVSSTSGGTHHRPTGRKFRRSAFIGKQSPADFLNRMIGNGKDPKELYEEIRAFAIAQNLGIDLPSRLPENIEEESLWMCLLEIISEPARRQKLPDINTFEQVLHLLKTRKKIVVLTGAGVSVSCGIPDFRSRNGIYARLAVEYPDLPDPQSMFCIRYFKRNQGPFFKFAKEIYPGQFKPSQSHRFIQLLEQDGRLLRNYTQNIDTLEQVAGIKNVVNCHGSFARATCMSCKYEVGCEAVKEDIMNQVIPRCPHCPKEDPLGIMKPNIVFFGEGLPEEFHQQIEMDKEECDLLIVIGSSLKVRPVAHIPHLLNPDVPQILINRESLAKLQFDVELLGNCDEIVDYLCRGLKEGFDHICKLPMCRLMEKSEIEKMNNDLREQRDLMLAEKLRAEEAKRERRRRLLASIKHELLNEIAAQSSSSNSQAEASTSSPAAACTNGSDDATAADGSSLAASESDSRVSSTSNTEHTTNMTAMCSKAQVNEASVGQSSTQDNEASVGQSSEQDNEASAGQISAQDNEASARQSSAQDNEASAGQSSEQGIDSPLPGEDDMGGYEEYQERAARTKRFQFNLVAQVPTGTYLFEEPNRYLFQGAEMKAVMPAMFKADMSQGTSSESSRGPSPSSQEKQDTQQATTSESAEVKKNSVLSSVVQFGSSYHSDFESSDSDSSDCDSSDSSGSSGSDSSSSDSESSDCNVNNVDEQGASSDHVMPSLVTAQQAQDTDVVACSNSVNESHAVIAENGDVTSSTSALGVSDTTDKKV